MGVVRDAHLQILYRILRLPEAFVSDRKQYVGLLGELVVEELALHFIVIEFSRFAARRHRWSGRGRDYSPELTDSLLQIPLVEV